ncbi:MAG: hypothetical protein SCH71_16350 [Desulfobulbaceae bacterium]|nr:hypothetical protein [Desulfobulbaceae bacterium]
MTSLMVKYPKKVIGIRMVRMRLENPHVDIHGFVYSAVFMMTDGYPQEMGDFIHFDRHVEPEKIAKKNVGI